MSFGLIKNNFKLMMRSKWIVVSMIFFPILTIIILAIVFDSMMSVDYSVDSFTLGLYMDKESKYNDFMPMLSETFEEHDIKLMTFPNTNIQDLMEAGTVDIFVEINEDTFTLYKTESTQGEAAIINSIFAAVFMTHQMADISLLQSDAGNQLSANDTNSGLLQYKKAAVNPVPSSIDYYGIIEVIYFIWVGSISLAAVIPSERKNRIISRMQVTPASKLSLYLGKLIPCFMTILIETAIIILVTIFLLDVQWGNPLGSMLILTLTALAASAFGLLLFTLFKSLPISIVIGWIISFTGGFLGGSFQTYMYSPISDSLVRWSLHYYLNRTLVEFSTKGGSEYALPCILILIAITVFSILLGYTNIYRRAGERG